MVPEAARTSARLKASTAARVVDVSNRGREVVVTPARATQRREVAAAMSSDGTCCRDRGTDE